MKKVPQPLKVFVGTEPKQWLACEVLRYSIAKRTQASLVFQELKHLPLQLKLPTITGFSIYRFAIPELCQYQGRAIYLDADIVVLSDLQELFQMDMGSKGALARRLKAEDSKAGRYTSVMLLDCSKLTHWKLNDWVPKMNQSPEVLRSTLWATTPGLVADDFGDLPENFNHLDYLDQSTKIIHYTNLASQPWRYPGHPYASAFLDNLKEAIQDEEIPRDAVEREIRYQHVRSDLLKEIGF